MRKRNEYYIIKLRTYASEYHMNKWSKDKNMKSYKLFIAACEKHHKFFWNFFEYLTNVPRAKMQLNYAGSIECAVELLEAEHDVVLSPNSSDGWFHYLIPKTNKELIQWIHDNKGDIPFKELKSMRIILDFHKPTNWRREAFLLPTDYYQMLEDKKLEKQHDTVRISENP